MRTAKLLAILLLFSILALSVVAQQWTIPYKRDTFSAEKKRAIAFGEDFTIPVGWTGIKYATNSRQTIGGLKGSTSVDTNLPYNEWIKRERNPQAALQYDPRVRGYPILHEFTNLYPVETPYYMDQGSKQLPDTPIGAVKIITTRDSQRDQRSYMPRSTIYLRIKSLPELGPYEVYEAWLVNAATGYALSIGRIIPPGLGQLNDLTFEISNDLYAYDYVLVTQEEFPNFLRGPRGQVVIMGEIPKIRQSQDMISAESYYLKDVY